MRKLALIAVAGLTGMLAATPAQAQRATENGVLVIYGDDPCPTNAEGNEIVVCARRPEAERFRIPQELRGLEVTPENRSWAVRQQDALNVGKTGIGSCSTVGPGGASGCFGQAAAAAKAERQNRERAASPLD
ncbi:hypothetical protein ACX0GZ_11150 [Sphingomonas aestuarii]